MSKIDSSTFCGSPSKSQIHAGGQVFGIYLAEASCSSSELVGSHIDPKSKEKKITRGYGFRCIVASLWKRRDPLGLFDTLLIKYLADKTAGLSLLFPECVFQGVLVHFVWARTDLSLGSGTIVGGPSQG